MNIRCFLSFFLSSYESSICSNGQGPKMQITRAPWKSWQLHGLPSTSFYGHKETTSGCGLQVITLLACLLFYSTSLGGQSIYTCCLYVPRQIKCDCCMFSAGTQTHRTELTTFTWSTYRNTILILLATILLLLESIDSVQYHYTNQLPRRVV